MFSRVKEKLKQHPRVKYLLLNLIVHPVKTRPRLWIRMFQFLYLKKGKGSHIYRSVRKDLVPFNHFKIGKKTIIESYSTLNNMVGDITIGDYTRIGLHNTVIGPVTIGNHTNLAQNITISGLNHNFQNPDVPIDQQGVSTQPIYIDDDVWVGTNAVILPGVKIGRHAVVAAGSVVLHDIPPFTVCGGNPAKIIKQYNTKTKKWERV